ncbi:MAG: transposase [Moorea sp. SIO1F2]|uniref:RNA-guided endonuclease InsQ/TnpB family protein n=1 Tax=unclassified Moorena TaxID=2683338 RepID=UPI0013B77AED|nr:MULTISPECIES: transposase [unclassified Moorena]NEO68244.1 transposase [Moorena sp. SIO3H5]NET81423.1 transposase [Moorena sp. SIO1F2]
MNYTYRIYPDTAQQELMLSWLETCRRLYNRCLGDLKDWMNSRKCAVDRCSLNREYIMSPDIPFPGYRSQKRQLTQWKKTESDLKEVHSQVTQDVIKRLHTSWESFRQRGKGFPRFKKYGRYQSFLFPQFATNPIKGDQIKLPKIGLVDLRLHREIPEGFQIKTVRVVSRCRGTKWFVVITIQADVSVPENQAFGRAIGVDVGLIDFLATSDNLTIPRPRFFIDLQRELKLLQRRASRKKKRSKNYEKAQIKVARLHHQIGNTRKDFHLKVAHQLCDQADSIFVEDIDYRVMAKGFLGKHSLDAGFGQFRELLKWVCWKRGKFFAEVDHKGTSKQCPECGTEWDNNLSIRWHTCDECGYSNHRDVASAEVMRNRGINKYPRTIGERKLSADSVLSGVLYLDKCYAETLNREVKKPAP